jgi:hypothetical protein
MRHFSADRKHNILSEYVRYSRTHGFEALALRHSVPGGAQVIAQWYQRWNGTVDSLKENPGRGRSRLLTRAEVSRHVRPRILAANRNNRAISYTQMLPAVNRNNRAISYTQMLPAVRRATGKSISIRTLRDYGRQLRAKSKRTTGRTNRERQCVGL